MLTLDGYSANYGRLEALVAKIGGDIRVSTASSLISGGWEAGSNAGEGLYSSNNSIIPSGLFSFVTHNEEVRQVESELLDTVAQGE